MFGQKIAYFLFLGVIGFFKILPFRLVYILSDGFYFLFYHLIGYRKSVVRKNLDYAFPEKSKQEKLAIEKKFYRNLTDLILESLKGYTISKKEALKRFYFTNPELLKNFYRSGKNVIMTVGHIGNWELANAAVVEKFEHTPTVFYKPLSNEYIDKYLFQSRSRFGAQMIPIYNTALHFSEKRENPTAVYMVADQYSTGKKSKKARFFGKETVFLRGPEFYSTKYNLPVIYIDIKKAKRGHYQATLSILEDNPTQLKENELTQKYANRLEKSIRENPELWMWSHKRWKDKKIY